MIYRYKVPLNGESIKVYLILAACAVIGIGSFFVLPKIGALAVLAICGFVAYQILKAMAKAGSARITTYTDGFSVRMADGTKLEFEWDKVSYAGYVVEGIQKGYMFVYEEDIDKFVQLPPAFENLAGFREEIEEHHAVEDCVMKPSETIKERIKSIFGTNETGADSVGVVAESGVASGDGGEADESGENAEPDMADSADEESKESGETAAE